MNKKILIISVILFILIIFCLSNISCIFKPKVKKKVYPISEKIYVGDYDPYNSFIGALHINIQVSWTLTNQILTIDLWNLDTAILDSKIFTMELRIFLGMSIQNIVIKF